MNRAWYLVVLAVVIGVSGKIDTSLKSEFEKLGLRNRLDGKRDVANISIDGFIQYSGYEKQYILKKVGEQIEQINKTIQIDKVSKQPRSACNYTSFAIGRFLCAPFQYCAADLYACIMTHVPMLQDRYCNVNAMLLMPIQAYLHKLAAIQWHTIINSSYHNVDFSDVFRSFVKAQVSFVIY